MGYLLAALLGGFLYFNSQATPDKAAELAQKAISQRFPGAKVSVEIEGKKGRDVLKGRFKTIRASISDFTLQDFPFGIGDGKKLGRAGLVELKLKNFVWVDIPVESAEFRFNEVQYDLKALKDDAQLQIVKSGPATAHLQLAAPALQKAFSAKLKDIQDPNLSLENGEWKLTGKRSFFGAPVPFVFTATPTGQGNRVVLENAKVSAAGLPIPPFFLPNLMKELNPIYVFDPENKWPFSIDLTNVGAQNGLLDMRANLKLKSK